MSKLSVRPVPLSFNVLRKRIQNTSVRGVRGDEWVAEQDPTGHWTAPRTRLWRPGRLSTLPEERIVAPPRPHLARRALPLHPLLRKEGARAVGSGGARQSGEEDRIRQGWD